LITVSRKSWIGRSVSYYFWSAEERRSRFKKLVRKLYSRSLSSVLKLLEAPLQDLNLIQKSKKFDFSFPNWSSETIDSLPTNSNSLPDVSVSSLALSELFIIIPVLPKTDSLSSFNDYNLVPDMTILNSISVISEASMHHIKRKKNNKQCEMKSNPDEFCEIINCQ
jgi:hypothetical protein